ncbi:MAG: hypothetical protein FWG30_01620 [Eubacteriaceae bacterium]|nr:hypothetical protein [Eubacteriaceae bacterium]
MIISNLSKILKKKQITYEQLFNDVEISLLTLIDVYCGSLPRDAEDWDFEWDELEELEEYLGTSHDKLFEDMPVDPYVTRLEFSHSFTEFFAFVRIAQDEGSVFGVKMYGDIDYKPYGYEYSDLPTSVVVDINMDDDETNSELLYEVLRGLKPVQKRCFVDEIQFTITDHVAEFDAVNMVNIEFKWKGEIGKLLKNFSKPSKADIEFFEFVATKADSLGDDETDFSQYPIHSRNELALSLRDYDEGDDGDEDDDDVVYDDGDFGLAMFGNIFESFLESLLEGGIDFDDDGEPDGDECD